MESLKSTLAWLLWLWMSAVLAGAFLYAPLAQGFIGQSSRILFFHVPMAWTAFVAFLAAGVWSVRYLFAGRHERHDRAARVAIELGLVFGLLATVTGSLWARIMWGAYWNWDPRQTSIVIALVFYGAYLALRDAVEDGEKRARLAAAYAALGLVVTPFLFFIVPRITFSLHPDSVVNARGKVEMEARMLQVLLASGTGFTALFFWLHNLRCRLLALEERAEAREGTRAPDEARVGTRAPDEIARAGTPASNEAAPLATRASEGA
ncbi:MAG TPA: cytochrome c biogenesis protein CcsA [Thermoanaerobaculia bacterium]|nr:cytochrome c biogenesis protein CcsA [Thermoanaerobaculia bacterium]